MTRFYALCALALTLAAAPVIAQSADRITSPPTGTSHLIGVKPADLPANSTSLGAPLYDNGPLVTATGNGAGGANTSALQTTLGLTSFGAGHNQAAAPPAGPITIADDFEVPAGGWTIDTIQFFAYQTGGNATTSSFTGYFVQIWDGDPRAPESSVVFGDLTTNRLASSTFSGIYRVLSTDPPTTANRPIYANTATIGTSLAAGTYWVQWGATGSIGSGPWAPPVTTVGAIPPGNALQFINGAWQASLDGANPLDFPFVIDGTGGTPSGPILGSTPATIAFGSVTTGSSSDATVVTLANPGSAPLVIDQITGSGAPFEFNFTGTNLTVAPGESTTFSVTFSPTEAGAATGSVVITSNDPGSPRTIALTGTGTAPADFDTYPSTGPPVAIPDNNPTGITSTITVTAPGTVADLDVSVNITHTWVGDLTISLAAGATTATIAERPGRAPGTTGAGCAANNMVIIADDEGTVGTIQDACVGVASANEAYTAGGRYTPLQPLSAFDGAAAAGSWVLSVNDQAGLDLGTLNSWALLMTRSVVSSETGAGAALARLSVAPNPSTSQAQIRLVTAAADDVRVVLHDALGREVRVLFEGSVAANQEAYIAVRTAGLAPGVYVVRAVGQSTQLTERLTVAR